MQIDFNKQEFKKFLKREIKRSTNTTLNDFNTEQLTVDVYGCSGVCKHYFIKNNVVFAIYDPQTTKYKKSFLDHLYKIAEVLHRVCSESSIEYTFKIKDVPVCVTIYCDSHAYQQDKLSVRFYYAVEHSKKLDVYTDFINEKEDEATLGIFKKEFGDVTIHNFQLDTSKQYNEFHYNEDFKDVLKTTIDELNKNESGMYLLYGEPGTGKSSLIRHLTTCVDRQFIYVPPHMVSSVFSLDLIDLFLDSYKGSVLIIEDAEKVLLKRDAEDAFNNSETMSAILNVTDGLYADLTKLSIIATYNCDRSKIDPAILRKGRLKVEYKFNKLKKLRAQKLIDKLGIKHTATADMSLADIYNLNQTHIKEQDNEHRIIGFGKA